MLKDVGIDNNFRIGKIDPNFRNLFGSALPFLNTRSNVIHTYIVYQYALAILKQERCDSEIVIAACILHDVGWSAIPESEQLKGFGPKIRDEKVRRKHEVEGVLIANKILKNLKYGEGLIEVILNIIDGHDTTESARSAEDAIVKDSDKLWRYSEIGFSIDVKRFKVQPLSHLKDISDSVDRWFLTHEGRRLAIHEANLRKLEYARVGLPLFPEKRIKK